MSILKGPWSYSRATMCSRAMYKRYVTRAPPEPRPEEFFDIDRRAFGSILHECADDMIKGLVKNGGWPDVKKMVNHHLTLVDEHGERPFFHLLSETAEIERRMQLFVHNFRCDWDMDLHARDELLIHNILGNEMKLGLTLDNKPCSFDDCSIDGLRGFVDYAEEDGDTLVIIDFKNRPAIFSKAELLRDEQLSCYLHLVDCHEHHRFKKFVVGIYYFEFGYTQLVDIEPEQVHENVDRLRARARVKESLEIKQIGPEPGFGKCQYCDYLASCEVGKESSENSRLVAMDKNAARELAQWLLVEEEKLKAVKKSLNKFTAEFGPIELDDKTQVGHSLSDTGFDYDKKQTLRVINKLLARGEVEGSLSDFVNLNTQAVKKLTKKHDDVLSGVRKPVSKTKFEFFRPANKTGVRKVKDGRKSVVHPQDMRKTRARVKRGEDK